MNTKTIIHSQTNEKHSNNYVGKVKNFVYRLFKHNKNYERVDNMYYQNNNLLYNSYLEPKLKFSTVLYHISSVSASLAENIKKTYSIVSKPLAAISYISPDTKKKTSYNTKPTLFEQRAISYAHEIINSKSSYDKDKYTLALNLLKKVDTTNPSLNIAELITTLEKVIKFEEPKLIQQSNTDSIIEKEEDRPSQIEQSIPQATILEKSNLYQHLIPSSVEEKKAYKITPVPPAQRAIEYAHELIRSNSSSYDDSHYTSALDKLKEARVSNKLLALKLALKCRNVDTNMKYLLTTNQVDRTTAINTSSISHEQANKLIQALSKVQQYNSHASGSNALYIDANNQITNHLSYGKNNYELLATQIIQKTISSSLKNASNQNQHNIALKQSMELLLDFPPQFITNRNYNAPKILGEKLKANTKYDVQDTLLTTYTSLLENINKANFGFCPSKYIEKVNILTQALQAYGISEQNIINATKQSLEPLYINYNTLSGSAKNRFKYSNHLLDAASSYMLDNNNILSKAYKQL